MIIVISPAKTLDLGPQSLTAKHTVPDFLDDSQELINVLKKKSPSQVAKLMSISDRLAKLNVERYREWQTPFTRDNAKQALLVFQGDVYQGFDCDAWKAADFTFAQKHLRILSGLYGLLRPLDLIQPYRLEMGTKLKTARGRSLYAFWGGAITDALNDAIKSTRARAFVNLASNEYFESIHEDDVNAPIVTPVFKDRKNGQYKTISFFAKKARGMMANFIIRNRIRDASGLRDFDTAGYYFDPDSSDEDSMTFLRDERK